MKVAVLEIGKYFDSPNVVRVFKSEESAMKHISKGFKKITSVLHCHYYEDDIREKWAAIKGYELEE